MPPSLNQTNVSWKIKQLSRNKSTDKVFRQNKFIRKHNEGSLLQIKRPGGSMVSSPWLLLSALPTMQGVQGEEKEQLCWNNSLSHLCPTWRFTEHFHWQLCLQFFQNLSEMGIGFTIQIMKQGLQELIGLAQGCTIMKLQPNSTQTAHLETQVFLITWQLNSKRSCTGWMSLMEGSQVSPI